jgi:hypothetical protein
MRAFSLARRLASPSSPALKLRVFDLQPPLRDNPLEAQLARMGEHKRAVALDRLAERKPV